MAIRNWPPVSLALLMGVLSCAREPGRIVIGRLDLVFRPDGGAASSVPPRGSAVLRPLEGGRRELVPVQGDTYQTRSAWLDPGLYLLEWQPALELEHALGGAASQASGGAALALEGPVIVIADGRVTTVNVRSALRANAMHDAIAGVVGR